MRTSELIGGGGRDIGQRAVAALTPQVSLRTYAKLLIRYRWSRFDEKKETEYLNSAVEELQQQGATIVDIKTNVSQPSGGATIVVHTVIYNAATVCRDRDSCVSQRQMTTVVEGMTRISSGRFRG